MAIPTASQGLPNKGAGVSSYSQESKAGTQIWDVGVLSTKPNTHLWEQMLEQKIESQAVVKEVSCREVAGGGEGRGINWHEWGRGTI